LEVADALTITAGTLARWRRRFASEELAVDSEEFSGSSVQATRRLASLGSAVRGPGPRAMTGNIEYDSVLARIDLSALLPKIDHEALFPRIDTSALLPKINYEALFPRIDTSALIPKINYEALFPKIDYGKLLPQPNFRELREWAQELRKRWWPPNWPAEVPDFEV